MSAQENDLNRFQMRCLVKINAVEVQGKQSCLTLCASNLVKRLQTFTRSFILNLQGQYAGREDEAIGYKKLYGRNPYAHETWGANALVLGLRYDGCGGEHVAEKLLMKNISQTHRRWELLGSKWERGLSDLSTYACLWANTKCVLSLKLRPHIFNVENMWMNYSIC